MYHFELKGLRRYFKINFFIHRQVRKSDGLKLSSEYGTLFAEVSAADGRNVEANLLQMAKLLQEKQDLDIQKAAAAATMSLSANTKRRHKKFDCC